MARQVEVVFSASPGGPTIGRRASLERWQGSREDVVVTIDPGRAFGSGLHETTRLILAFLDEHLEVGDEVLDVGTGSGVLAIASLKLGAKLAVATDIDPDAWPVARENAEANRVSDRLRVEAAPLPPSDERFRLVLANIQAKPLIELAGALIERVGPGGQLVLSGILADQTNEVASAFGRMTRDKTMEMGEWRALVFRRSSDEEAS